MIALRNTVVTAILLLVVVDQTHDAESRRWEWTHSKWTSERCRKMPTRDEPYTDNDVLPESPSLPSICGRRSRTLLPRDRNVNRTLEPKHKISKRIVGGRESEKGEWPWLAAIGSKRTGQICGGSLIGQSWVLCAAHCFGQFNLLTGSWEVPQMLHPCRYNVRLGEHSLTGSDESHVDATPKRVIVHPDYDGKTFRNDISLVQLQRPVSFTDADGVSPICLPSDDQELVPGEVCHVAGWGDTSGKFSFSDVIRHVALPIISMPRCNRLNAYKGKLYPGIFCAGYRDGHKDSCTGDSGGPLVCQHLNESYFQAGIVSWGAGCGRPDTPGIYTDVHYFLPWIRSVIRRYGL